MHRRVEPQSGEPRGVRRESQGRVEVVHRQREPARAQMEIGPVLQRRGEVRIMTDRGAEGVERLGLPAALAQRHAHQVARDRMARRLRTDDRERRQRVAPAARVDQLLRALEAEVVAGGIGVDGQLDRHQRRVAGAQVPVAQAQAMEGTGVSGVPRGGLLERRDRVIEPAGLAQRNAPVVEQRGASAGRLRERAVLGLGGDPVAAVGEGMGACQRGGRAWPCRLFLRSAQSPPPAAQRGGSYEPTLAQAQARLRWCTAARAAARVSSGRALSHR